MRRMRGSRIGSLGVPAKREVRDPGGEGEWEALDDVEFELVLIWFAVCGGGGGDDDDEVYLLYVSGGGWNG
jgi:hypothetical protein